MVRVCVCLRVIDLNFEPNECPCTFTITRILIHTHTHIHIHSRARGALHLWQARDISADASAGGPLWGPVHAIGGEEPGHSDQVGVCVCVCSLCAHVCTVCVCRRVRLCEVDIWMHVYVCAHTLQPPVSRLFTWASSLARTSSSFASATYGALADSWPSLCSNRCVCVCVCVCVRVCVCVYGYDYSTKVMGISLTQWINPHVQ
jgi:hypothetical protein